MNFTSGEWLALITAISALVVVVGGVVVNVIVSLRTTLGEVRAKVTETSDKVAEVAIKVDGAASASAAEIKALQGQLTLMREVLAGQKQTAAVLAQAKTVPPLPITTTDALDPSASLQNIDKNTAETAKNTARTDATVKKMEQDQG